MTAQSDSMGPVDKRDIADNSVLYVDLDGTLVKTDLLLESLLVLIKRNITYVLMLPLWLIKGRAYFKAKIAERVQLRFDLLPYNSQLLDYLRIEKDKGRNIILATASNEILARGVSEHLNIFSSILASDWESNLKGKKKLHAILECQRGRQFTYAGDSISDTPIFERASKVILVNPGTFVESVVRNNNNDKDVLVIKSTQLDLKEIIKSIRLHQWLKNALIFVPLFTSHLWFDLSRVYSSIIGFVAFSFCASSIYLLNDLFDLESDRGHHKKRYRPLASGVMPIGVGALWSLLLMAAGLGVSSIIEGGFQSILLIYVILTSAYTLLFKSIVLVDVIFLAALYTVRVVAGAEAISVEVSFWLLAFSMFMFFSLSLVKRCSELIALRDLNRESSAGRDYRVSDLSYLQIMGLSSGYMATLVAALYINDPVVRDLYSNPQLLWLLCPLFMFFVSRMWLKTGRGEMHSDPVVYAMKDRTSAFIFVFLLSIVLLAA